MTKLDKAQNTLATIAFAILHYHDQDYDPTLHDISVATTQAASVLNLNGDITAIDGAVCQVCERHNWQDKSVVIFNGHPKVKARKWEHHP